MGGFLGPGEGLWEVSGTENLVSNFIWAMPGAPGDVGGILIQTGNFWFIAGVTCIGVWYIVLASVLNIPGALGWVYF